MRLRTLASQVGLQQRTASALVPETVWVSPVADRARTSWSWADGQARTGADELAVAARQLDRLADAVDDLRADMGRAYDRARSDLQQLVTSGSAAQGAIRVELAELPWRGSPHWAQVAGAPEVARAVLAEPASPGDPGPTAPPAVVVTDPERTRWLARAWEQAGVAIAEGRGSAALLTASLPLPELDAWGLPGRAAADLMQLVLGPGGSLFRSADRYHEAGLTAVGAADKIDGLGATFLPVVDGEFVGTAGSALQVLLSAFTTIDTAAKGGTPDGIVSLDDLRAAAADQSLPPEVREAARQLAEDPDLMQLVRNMRPGDVLNASDGKIREADLRTFLELRTQTEVLYGAMPQLVALSDHPNGTVTSTGLQQALDEGRLPQPVLSAARWMLDHPQAMGALGLADRPYDMMSNTLPTMFGRDEMVRLLVNGHAFDGRPDAAREFVRTLPVPVDGGTGIPLGLCSDKGVQGLANAALTQVAGDLPGQVDVISHLPETSSGTRNALISAGYALMSQEMDLVLNGPELAGHLDRPGHSGGNWMTLAPWASDAVRAPITGDFTVLGVIHPPQGARQAAADGNQWIFSDIGGRYAAFLQLYRDGARPSTAEMQGFFDNHFGAGDDEVRRAFAAYAQVPLTTSQVQRQALTLQGNVLIATGEQAGAQHWLEQVSVGPDAFATQFIRLPVGDRTVGVQDDLPQRQTENNLVVGRPLLDLDPGSLTAGQLAPDALAGVHLKPLSGVQEKDPEFPNSLAQMAERGGWTTRPEIMVGSPFPVQVRVAADPDSLAGTGATSWTDRDERMWEIVKLFEQSLTDPTLVEDLASRTRVGFDQSVNAWLAPSTGLRP